MKEASEYFKMTNPNKSEKERSEFIDKVCELAKCDIKNGKLKRVKELLKQNEQIEAYEVCAGIKKALKELKITSGRESI